MTMKRVCLPLLAIVCLLLTGCAGREVEKAYAGFSERVNAAQSLTFTANVRAEYEHKTAKFTLSYTEDDSGGAVTVLAPELIAGVTARVEPGSTVLQYDGVVLDTGSLDSLGLSPMSSLPVLVQAMKSGHLTPTARRTACMSAALSRTMSTASLSGSSQMGWCRSAPSLKAAGASRSSPR